ncbi:hypothetical protein HYT53_01915 [Candidatus Woesearchaeota archaeon]|nr:hypothetical protein [Candidatus Woesearchaeota archaeon]
MPKQPAPQVSCSDRIKNQNEEGVDCGGACKPCSQKNFTVKKTETQKPSKAQAPAKTMPIGMLLLGISLPIAIYLVILAVLAFISSKRKENVQKIKSSDITRKISLQKGNEVKKRTKRAIK